MRLPSRLKKFFVWSQEHTYAYLLLALLAMTLSGPVLHWVPTIKVVDEYLVIAVLLAAVYNVTRESRHVYIALGLGFPAILAQLMSAYIEEISFWGGTLIFVSAFVFFGYLFGKIVGDVTRGNRLSGEKIFGSICAYFLLGVIWSLAYSYMDLVHPGSFSMNENLTAWRESHGGSTPQAFFVYYSFVTLTTLGYGDITPVTMLARTLSWLEALVGQLYLAIMVARFVGIHVAEALRRDTQDAD